MKKPLVSIILLLLFSTVTLAQGTAYSTNRHSIPEQSGTVSSANSDNRHLSRWSIETNVADLGFLGTVNGTVQFAASRHFTVLGQARYNNWTFNKAQENQFENRQLTLALGTRFWTWYTYSGWWIEAKCQFQEYNRGGIGTLQTEEGYAWGGALSAGYSLQLNRWFNLDFGLGLWAGTTKYTVYSCPHCGRKLDAGNKFFILPNEVTIAAMFVF